jgi:hypothetical protein
VELTRKYVLQDDVIDRVADSILILLSGDNTRIPYLQKQLAGVQKRIDNLLNAIEEGLFNASQRSGWTDWKRQRLIWKSPLPKRKSKSRR